MSNFLMMRPLLLSPDAATVSGSSAPAVNSGSEGSGSGAPSGKTASSPGGKSASDAPPASKTEAKTAPKKEAEPGIKSDPSTGIPRKSLKQKLEEIREKNIKKEKEEAVKDAKEAGKKEAKTEIEAEKKTSKEEEEKEKTPKKEEKKKYEPNYKYTLKDKELEFDEFLRGSIIDEDTEKKVRDLYQRASGMEYHQGKTREIEQQLAQQTQGFSQVMQKLQEANEAFSRDDLDSVFQVMNIPQEKVLQWLQTKAQYQEMDPDSRRVYDERRNAQIEARTASKQAEEMKQQQFKQETASIVREFELITKIPQYEEYAKAFDASRKEGAFRSAVADRGELAYMRGKRISVEDAIKEVMEVYGAAPAKALKTSADSKGTVENSSSKGSRSELPVIPNVSGRSEAAVSQVPKYKSIADLKKRYKELVAEERV